SRLLGGAMPAQQPISDISITRAVEITKAAIPAGNWLNGGDTVAKFIETIANKLEELRNGPAPR
ncbi:MAG TPA: hypothetical protein VFQ18_04340, partial [Candidatus Acidoferrum sp.]|nr:hypothetical protein [Candidatus Acidoferrum sp.]